MGTEAGTNLESLQMPHSKRSTVNGMQPYDNTNAKINIAGDLITKNLVLPKKSPCEESNYN